MHTLPRDTLLRIRQPSKPLVAWVGTVVPDLSSKCSRIFVQLTDVVVRHWWRYRATRWYDFATGQGVVADPASHLDIEPGDATFEYSGGELVVSLSAFTACPLTAVELDIARDAFLDSRPLDGTRIARSLLPYDWPLFCALLVKERQLLGGQELVVRR